MPDPIRRRTPSEVESYVAGYKAGVRMLEGKITIALSEAHVVIDQVIESALATNDCDECGAAANPSFGNAPGPWHEETCSLYGTRAWEAQGISVGDTVLVRLHTPGPGGPSDPKNSASVENYKRHFTRLVKGEVVGRERLFHVKFTITEDNYDDWYALMPDHVGMPGDRHWDEHETATIGTSWIDYDVEPEQIERVIKRSDLTPASQSG